MPNRIRYVMVGGFLGAGKTTTLARLARHYMDRGLSVGIVTNDQASDLVDTNTLRAQGFDVGEVAGACFCCNFDELMTTARRLGAEQRPDVILAEPVGSCTDLVATVLQPIKRLFEAEFSIAPYAVILKPSHGRRILRGEKQAGFSPKAAYILTKQLEEADAIILNRIDELEPDEVNELADLVQRHHPGVPIVRTSALTGDGFEALVELLDQEGDFGRRVLDIDYDVYAEGEAELGWLNSSVRVEAQEKSAVRSPESGEDARRAAGVSRPVGAPFSLDALLLDVVTRLSESLAEAGYETAHLKAIGLWEGFFGVANLVSSDSRPVLSLPARRDVQELDLIVNARVACDPAVLERLVQEAVTAVCEEHDATAEFRQTQSFRPGRPVPTHRYAGRNA